MSDSDGLVSYLRPLAVDGDTAFVEIDDPGLVEEAEEIFRVQWDYVHGWVDDSALERLPERFMGRQVVRDPGALDDLARVGSFDIEELYRELHS